MFQFPLLRSVLFLPLFVTGLLSAARADEPATNYLTNGSFELGLGAEPFYPGWRMVKADFDTAQAPALPVIDRAVFHSGAQSLKLSRNHGRNVLTVDFQSPTLPPDTKTRFSFWTKAGRTGVELLFGVCPADGKGKVPNAPKLAQGALSEGWQQWVCQLPPLTGIVPLKLEFSSKQETPFEVWIDDISWTPEPLPAGQSRQRSGQVEVVLLPSARNGVHFTREPLVLKWSADADSARTVAFTLKLQDLTRRGEPRIVWEGTAPLGPSPQQGEIPLRGIQRGAYLAVIEARDSASGKILGAGRERFTVMEDLRRVPAPVAFDVGYHGGIEWSNGDLGQVSFNWRGHWSLDEFFATNFQTGFRVQRDIWDWVLIEPEEHRFDWHLLDARIEAAHRNGCTTMVCLPHKPLNLPRAEYREVMANPQNDDGRWLYKTATDISPHSVRSNPMGSSNDPQKRNILLAPNPASLVEFMLAVARRYQDKITAVEYINEPNLFINPKGLIEYYHKPVYKAFKEAAPNLPFLMDQTADFSADGNGYTGQFLSLGGFNFCDGVTYHPYGAASLLQDKGLSSAKAIEKLAAQYSTAEKKMMLGMTEIHGLGGKSNMTFVRAAAVQRALLDWSIGCRWSAGVVLSRNNFYEGVGPRNWYLRGPFAPGVGAVHMNALYSVLGGYRQAGRIELDDKVLILRLERAEETSGRERYAVAITAGQTPLRKVLLQVDLGGIDYAAFDACGEPVKRPERQNIELGMEPLYLRSNDARLLERLQSARILWGQEIGGEIETLSGPESEAVIYATGLPPQLPQTCALLERWTLLKEGTPAASESVTPQQAGIANDSGQLVCPPEKIRTTDVALPYVLLTGKGDAVKTWYWAGTSIHSRSAQTVTFSWSATGPAVLWLNGKEKVDFSGQPYDWMGRTSQTFQWTLAPGINHVLVRVASQGNPCAFALGASGNAATATTTPAVDKEGFVHQWKLIGPWKNPRNAQGAFVGNAHSFPPEQQAESPDLFASYFGLDNLPLIWIERTFANAAIPLPWNDSVSYAFAAVEVDRDTACQAALGSDDGFALWINGKLIGRNAASRGIKIDGDKFPVQLKKGRNAILFKVDDTGAGGGFVFRFLDEKGLPLAFKVID